MSTVCIIQARNGSSRLPGKVMEEIAGHSMLHWTATRARQTAGIDEVVIATTTHPRDDELARWCRVHGWACFRGSEEDVLDRYYRAALAIGAEHVVRITSDCPMIDPGVSADVIEAYHARDGAIDYASNCHPKTWPIGLETEIFSVWALEWAWRNDPRTSWREHVTPYLSRRLPQERRANIAHDEDLSHLRWTVDTRQDLELIRHLFEAFGHGYFGWREALELWKSHPSWQEINADVREKVFVEQA